MTTATNRQYVADYGPLENYYKEIQNPAHPNHFSLGHMPIPQNTAMEKMANPAPLHLLLFKTHSVNYQKEPSNTTMDAVENAVNLPINMEFVPVLSTSSKLVISSVLDRQDPLVHYFIQPVSFSQFIVMECV
jgi:hypothetical protein